MRLPLFLRYRIAIYFLVALMLGAVVSWIFYAQATMREITGEPARRTLQIGTLDGENVEITETSSKPGFHITYGADEGEEAEVMTIGSRFDQVKQAMPMAETMEWLISLAGLLALIAYHRPIVRVLKKGKDRIDQETLGQAKVRILNLTRFAFALCWLIALADFVNQAAWEWAYFHGLTVMQVTTILVGSFCFGLVSSSVVLTWFDLHLLKFIPRVFPDDELFTAKRDGKSMTLNTKILLMTYVTSIIPLCFLTYINVTSNLAIKQTIVLVLQDRLESDLTEVLPSLLSLLFSLIMVGFFIIIALIMSDSIRKGITRPQALLAQRMGKVKDGNYDLHTTVYTNDEIGQLKAGFNEMLDGLIHREFIKDTFGKFMSIEISRQIIEEGKINLGGEQVEATVLFSDIRNFTPMSESMTPDQVVSFLNDYFAHTVKPILDNRGVVNKYIGDCIMALFGVPDKIPDHADRAVAAALSMREALDEYNRTRRRDGQPPVNIGIGIHSGSLVAGNIGAPERIEYTVIGDTVNVASRIESQTKTLASTILISQEVHNRLSEELRSRLKLERCPEIKVKGRAEPLDLYKVL